MDLNKYLEEIHPRQNEYMGTSKQVNKDTPLVSIIVTTYQHFPYIKQNLEGLLKQKVDFNYEILVGEDGSSDGTRDICKEYAEKYPDKIRLFLRDRNESALRDKKGKLIILNSRLLRMSARGKYIATCEGDDFWIDSLKLQKQVEFLEANPDFGLVHTDIEYIDQYSNIIEPPKGLHEGIRNRVINGYIYDYYLNNSSFILTASCIYRKSLIDLNIAYQWFVYDQWVFIELARKSKVFFIPEKMTAYRINPNSMMQSFHSYVSDRYYYAMLDQLYRFYADKENTAQYYKNNKKVKLAIFKCYVEIIKAAFKGKIKDNRKIVAILTKNPDFLLKIPMYIIKALFNNLFSRAKQQKK